MKAPTPTKTIRPILINVSAVAIWLLMFPVLVVGISVVAAVAGAAAWWEEGPDPDRSCGGSSR